MSTATLTDYRTAEFEEADCFERMRRSEGRVTPTHRSASAIRGASRSRALRSSKRKRTSGITLRRSRQSR